ncbi:tetratricopeptide repeat protein [Streptomyces sp. NPDC003509]
MTGGQYDGLEQEFLADLRRLGELHQKHLAKTWSLRAAARAIGLSPTTVSEWLKGSRFPQQPEAFTNLITLLRTALAEARIDVPASDRHLLDRDAWRTRHQAVVQQRAQTVSAGVRRAQATAALAEAEARARFADLPDKPRPVSAWTAQQLGVHPAIHGTTNGAEGAFVLPDYVERNHDQRLRAYLDAAATDRQAVMVVVRGESCTGKTRTAFEAVRACLGDWQLAFPKDPDGLLALLAADTLTPRTVLWLNEAQDFLTGPAGEAAAAALRRRMEEPGPLAVLATLWLTYHRTLTATPEPGNDSHPHARALLAPVVPVDVPGRFTADDLENLRARDHRSLTAADQTSPSGTITQTLAAGPQLVDHHEQAVLPHGPYGKAIITAAMDARRLGHTSPLPTALLQAAAPGYLTEEERAAAPETWFADALAYARIKVKGVVAALQPVADPNGMGALPDVYHLADYLDHHGRESRRILCPPPAFWNAAVGYTHATADLRALASAAADRGRKRAAAQFYRRSADAGDIEALLRLARVRYGAGDETGGERLVLQAAESGGVGALHEAASLMEHAGRLDESFSYYQRAAAAGDINAHYNAARMLRGTSREEACIAWLKARAEAGDARALSTAALMLGWADRPQEALVWLRGRIDAGDVHALYPAADLLREAGQVDEAINCYQRDADAGGWGAAGAADLLEQAGRLDEAIVWYRRAAEKDVDDHRSLSRAADLLQKTGRMEEAITWLQARARAGDMIALSEAADLLRAAGRVEKAIAWLRERTDGGDTHAPRLAARLLRSEGHMEEALAFDKRDPSLHDAHGMSRAASLLRAAGRVDEAIMAYQRASALEDGYGHGYHALSQGADLLRAVGRVDEAIAWLQERTTGGDTRAPRVAAALLEKEGRRNDAVTWWQRAADAGDVLGVGGLARLRESAGDADGAKQLRRFGLTADGSIAEPWDI